MATKGSPVSSRAAAAINADDPEPLWIQAANLIVTQIEDGVIKAGARLPAERDLCQQLGISRVTLRKALAKLVADGILRPSHGRGWYAAPVSSNKEWPNTLESFSETARRMGLQATSTVLVFETRPSTIDEAELLLIAPGTAIRHLKRVRLLGGVPIALDTTVIPAHLVRDLDDVDFTGASLYAELERLGVVPARADATIEATEADADLARRLDLTEGKPILSMRQIASDRAERPLFVSTIKYAGDRYRLRTSFARTAPGAPQSGA